MVMGMGMRSVWISLRAMNYTDQAFRQSIINIDKLTTAEKNEYTQLVKRLEVARLNIQTGVLYAAMTAMVAQQLFNLLGATEVGAQYMAEFNDVIKELKVTFADALFTSLKPFLDVVMTIMRFLNENPALAKLIVSGAMLAVVFIGLKGVFLVLSGAIAQHNANLVLTQFLEAQAAKQGIALTASNTGLAASFVAVGAALNNVLVGFTLFYMLGQIIGNQAGAIIAAIVAITLALWSLFIAESVSSLGLTLAAGAGAAAAALALQSQNTGGFGVGTRALPTTGMFLGHKGEIVYNPRTDKPTGVGKEIFGEGSEKTQYNKIDFYVDTLNTKSDFDEVDEKIGSKLARAMRNGR